MGIFWFGNIPSGNPDSNLSALEQGMKFFAGCKTNYPGAKQTTQVQNKLRRCKTNYPGAKQTTQVQNKLPRCKTNYPGAKQTTQVQSKLRRLRETDLG
jgi:hypothetical protein